LETAQIRNALAEGEISALILFGANPLRDYPDAAGWKRALSAADLVIAFSMLENETTAVADLVFPLESHAEKDGTVTHPDGRLQRVRPSAARPGDVRPGWQVLAELSAALGHETGIESAPDALAAVTEAVPFYRGITDAEIGGRGIRWQDRPAADSLPRGAPPREVPDLDSMASARSVQSSPGEAIDGRLLLGTYRDLWAGPVTELNSALRFLKPGQAVEVSPGDAERLGLSHGDRVLVGSNGTKVEARVLVRDRVVDGVCFLIEGTDEGNANALLNGGGEAVSIEKVGG
jgi:NADH-quinone oxidoreductase subunit G